MIRVAVITPHACASVATPGAPTLAYGSTAALVDALARDYDVAVLLRGSEPIDEEEVAAAIRAAGRPVIEVQAERWDGRGHSAVSGACRGVISGFGERGIAAAVALLEREAALNPRPRPARRDPTAAAGR